MARPTLLTHRKFRRLVARLGGDTATAIGSLELLWLAAYESGDDAVGDATDVEAAAHWRGASGDLASALADSGFLDRDGDLFVIHDLDDHAPDYVQKRRARELERRQRGVTLRELRAAAGAAGGKQTASKRQASGGHLPANGQQVAGNRQANGVTPAPAPAPALDTPPTPASGGGAQQAFAGHSAPTAKNTRADKRKAALERRRIDAVAVLTALNDARTKSLPGTQRLAPSEENLRHIVDRLEAGATLDECKHVIAVCVAEVKANAESAQWFNTVTPFRPDNFARKVAMRLEDVRGPAAPKPTAPEPHHRPDTLRPYGEVIAGGRR